ncbi:MAG: bifunctional riboflavin kinase/FAD synthetase [Verrucomicrobia bacterium]|nr:bifunctional riboflavin kinase/FAD synthetase [Verrucomicrobiota bacterium]
MRVFRSIEELSTLRGPVHLAIGVFDGVHRGHLEVIGAATAGAAVDGGSCVVLTFDPHPAVLLRPDKAPAILTSTQTKTRLLAARKVDAVLLHPFNREVAGCRARDFIESLASACAPLAQIAVGWNWTFGRNREGDTALLQSLAEELGFTATVLDAVHDDGRIISSTAIRAALADGDVAQAARLLGRGHSVVATVSTGRQLGRQLGFPTANLPVEGMEVLLPPNGVYAVRACGADGQLFDGVANLGVRPTIDTASVRLLEVHLFDYSGDLYGKELRVSFIDRLRPEMKFDGIEALKSQMAADLEAARVVLGDWSQNVHPNDDDTFP